MEFNLTENEKSALLKTARESILAVIEERDAIYEKPFGKLTNYCGAFVTLHLNGNLRGCIGHMKGVTPLSETIKEMAESSAYNDPRFNPLTKEEYSDIDIEISVLSPLEIVKNTEDIKVGTHGLYITSCCHSGVLLPQVAVEQNWDRKTFLTQTCFKAGIPGDSWKDPSTEIQMFSAIIFKEK